MKLLVLSDTHIHAIANNDEIAKRFAFIQSTYPDHLIIVTGDVTDDGSSEQYANAQELFRPFADKIFPVPGNHDYGPLGNFFDAKAIHRFDFFAQGCFANHGFINKRPVTYTIADCLIIMLNSNLQTDNPFDFSCGEIGLYQLQVLKAILEENADKTKIVCLHHHPFIHSDPTMELNDAKDFLRIIYQRADVLLFGHKHEKGRWQNKVGCTLILASGAAYQEPFAWEIEVTPDKKIYSQEVRII